MAEQIESVSGFRCPMTKTGFIISINPFHKLSPRILPGTDIIDIIHHASQFYNKKAGSSHKFVNKITILRLFKICCNHVISLNISAKELHHIL